jgi:hypothetical protein
MSPKRVDANQVEIVQALRRCGCTVQVLSDVGKGCPDLLVGVRGINALLEVKDGAKTLSKRKLTPDEQEWHDTWRGEVVVVNSVDEALSVLGLM